MWFFGLIVVVLIGAVAVVASGRWGAMSTAYDDRPDMTVPARQALTSTDIESARFAVGVRGYRMDEVDTLLERVAKEVAERDRRIADLERAVAPIVDAPEGAGFTSKSRYDASEFEDTGPHQPIMVGGDFPAGEPSKDEPKDSTAEVPQVAVPAAPAEPETESAVADDDEPETSELPRTRHEAAADEYERLQAEARAVLEAQSQPVTPRRTPATPQFPQQPEEQQPEAAVQQSPEQAPPAGAQDSAQQQSQQQQSPQQSADLQSADAQPVSAEQAAPTQHWTQLPPHESADVEHEPAAPAQHWTQQEQYVVREQQAPPAQQQPAAQQQAQQQAPAPQEQFDSRQSSQQQQSAQQQSAQQSGPQQSAHPQSGPQQSGPQQGGQQGEGEGWQFWPPADQEGEGAYQRPS
ncbi:DivIVA domain-containing protein [Kribbella sp. NPDC058693]|uniref:DivIVA domain-containing protein n=1 Tax=Kribbella sp. NPDC058693 TaxID=3346602 RepID=UPI00364F4F6A